MSTRKKNSLTQRILFGLATATICIGSAVSPVYADTPTPTSVTTGTAAATGTNAMPVQAEQTSDHTNMGTVSGTTTVTNIADKSTMNITQTTNNAVIYWDSFN